MQRGDFISSQADKGRFVAFTPLRMRGEEGRIRFDQDAFHGQGGDNRLGPIGILKCDRAGYTDIEPQVHGCAGGFQSSREGVQYPRPICQRTVPGGQP